MNVNGQALCMRVNKMHAGEVSSRKVLSIEVTAHPHQSFRHSGSPWPGSDTPAALMHDSYHRLQFRRMTLEAAGVRASMYEHVHTISWYTYPVA